MKIVSLNVLCGIFIFMAIQSVYSQMVGFNAYMIGQHVEVGIDQNGMEGTDDLASSNSRGPGSCLSSDFGFVADSNNDGWTDYNGDYFTPGVPENGFGLDINGVEVGNNATPCGSELYNIISSAPLNYSETTDSIVVMWTGTVSGIDMTITYELQKDLYYFTTKVRLENTTASPINNLYYYRTMDPDNNQTLGWGYGTTNKIISQSGMANDSVIVRATQNNVWEAWVQFEGYGPNWRAYHGGFSNRDGSEIWSGLGFSVLEGSEVTADAAIGLAYRIATLDPGAAAAEEFQFNVRFAEDSTVEEPDPGIGLQEDESNRRFELYPNPGDGLFTIACDGEFEFLISDPSGRVIEFGKGNDQCLINLSDQSSGLYFIKVRGEGGKFKVRKLLID
jgi:hypothetical protein